MVKKQTILYMLVILQHKCNGKTVLDVFVGNHLDLLAPPYLEKDYLRYPGGGLGRCTCIVLCILQNMSKCRFHNTNVYGFGFWFFFSKLGGYNPAKSMIFFNSINCEFIIML